ILGAEIARDYKRKPRVYLAACEAFDLPPGDCMMVAAHSDDLQAAAKCGLRTAHVARPNERGPGIGEVAPTVPVDVATPTLAALAAKLGACGISARREARVGGTVAARRTLLWSSL